MKVAVIGAGTMGRGIAQAFAQCDEVEKVYLCDIKQEFADGGKNNIKKGFDKRIAKGKMAQEDADKILNKIQTGLNSQAVDPDLVVEAALEVMDIKKSTFKDLQENIVKNPDCIFASNTSSLSITEIGNGLQKPIIGMHFFNPAPVMKLVEVIAGINTPQRASISKYFPVEIYNVADAAKCPGIQLTVLRKVVYPLEQALLSGWLGSVESCLDVLLLLVSFIDSGLESSLQLFLHSEIHKV